MKKISLFIIMTFLLGGIFLFYRPPALISQLMESENGENHQAKTSVTEIEQQLILPAKLGISSNREIKYTAGKDQEWFTQDDKVYLFYESEYDQSGRLRKKVCYKPGKDTFLYTPDDEAQEYWVYKYNNKGKVKRELYFIDCGPDKRWFTPDDKLASYTDFKYDAQGNKEKAVKYCYRGEMLRYTRYEYDAQGSISKEIEYSSSGLDGRWFTADDEIEKYHCLKRDKDGVLLRLTECDLNKNGQGPDGEWFTEDDVISSIKSIDRSKEGYIQITKKYISSGPDREWFTGDDLLQYYTRRKYTKRN